MPKYVVEIVRDASVRYQATVEAASMDEVRNLVGKNGYKGETITDWERVSVSSYDNVEEFSVMDLEHNVLHEESMQ